MRHPPESTTAARSLLALALLALPSLGQAPAAQPFPADPLTGVWPAAPAAARVFRPLALPTGAGGFDLGAGAWDFDAFGAPDLSRLSVAAAALEAAPRPVTRESLEGGIELLPVFEDMPGGIVLGCAASPAQAWDEVDLELDERGLALVGAGGRWYLPETRREVLAAGVEFALRADDSDVLIDISQDGVRLTEEFAGTPLAGALTRADGAPFRWIPHLPWGKTVIADEGVTFAADPDGETLQIACTLELRAYVPARTESLLQGSLLVAAYRLRSSSNELFHTRGPWPGDVPAALLDDVEPVFELAGLLGVLRWADQRAPGRLAAIRDELREERARASGPGPLSLLEQIAR